MNASEYAVISESLAKRFGRKQALDSVSAHVPVGAIYGLMGPNGAGKTTFVRCLLNLLTPTHGTAAVLGHDVVRDSVAVRKRIGHVAALQPLWDSMRVKELADFMAGCYPRWNPDAVSSVLTRVGIDANDRLQDLSRGQRTLAAVAVAIGHEPDLLILDEALTGLDPIARREVLRSVIEVMHSEGRTVLITGQDIADMERICDYVGFLVKGRLVLESSLDDLKAGVKRIRLIHPAGAAPDLPPQARRVERSPRETRFTVSGLSPAMLDALTSADIQAEVEDLGLEDIFIDLVQPDSS
ncbi:MAG TPA: ABC transporter ATP-binding protein [Armatimonadota bacterium]|nr:ABC transporter ATP-binding protein [Armatimonadota bacterium]